MAEIHKDFTFEGEAGRLDAILQGVESSSVEVLCPKAVCEPINYHFPVQEGQTVEEALSQETLPECPHGTRILKE